MKRRALDTQNFGEILDENEPRSSKVVLVETVSDPCGYPLVSQRSVIRKTYNDLIQLADGVSNVNSAIKANACNKLDVIGRQMKNLHEIMMDVVEETRQNIELHEVACNFVKKPGHVYHLYKRDSGQKYFGMLSPEEWINSPHEYLGSFKLESDLSWSPVENNRRYDGLDYLKNIMHVQNQAITL